MSRQEAIDNDLHNTEKIPEDVEKLVRELQYMHERIGRSYNLYTVNVEEYDLLDKAISTIKALSEKVIEHEENTSKFIKHLKEYEKAWADENFADRRLADEHLKVYRFVRNWVENHISTLALSAPEVDAEESYKLIKWCEIPKESEV